MSLNLIQNLIDVAMGRKSAEIVIRGGKWVNVQSGEIIPDTDIAIIQGHIAFVGPNANHTINEKTKIIEAHGQYLVPGLLDAHVHIESSMVSITEFVKNTIIRGTTGIFIDPHEIANVFGLKGVKLMVDEAQNQPIHVWVQMPSCVPSLPGMETSGASIGYKEVKKAMKWKGIIGLGEMMNFVGVCNGDKNMLKEMSTTQSFEKTIGGHYASQNLGIPFHGYVASGVEDDHEGTRVEDAVARVRQGMKAMLRYGSAWFDVAAQIKAITEKKLDSRHFILCTDDSHIGTLIKEGHMDRVLNHTISEGLNPMTAIQMMTINTAEHFGLSKEIGMIAPGRWADILLVDDLMNFKANMVIAKGKVVSENKKLNITFPENKYPKWVMNSINVKNNLNKEDFIIKTKCTDETIANVIGVIENQAPTRHLKIKVKVEDGEVKPNINSDIAKIALIERHKSTGKVMVGLVNGFGFTHKCAIGSTVAHDSHHMIIAGTDETNMAIAANELIKCGGGQIVVCNEQIIGKVELPIAGLMSNESGFVVEEKVNKLLNGFKECGCKLNSPNMQLSLLGLVVIPELRISDKGLVDVNNFKFISVLE